MEDNIKKRLSGILSGLDGRNKEKTKNVYDMLKSEEGKRLLMMLSDADKKNLIEKFMSMDPDKVSKGLESIDYSTLKNLTVEDIRKKIK